jgi:hypothetical protein
VGGGVRGGARRMDTKADPRAFVAGITWTTALVLGRRYCNLGWRLVNTKAGTDFPTHGVTR